MRRFFVPKKLLTGVSRGDEISLPKDVTHHIKTVLRRAVGSDIVLVDGQGTCCHCSIREFSPKSATVEVKHLWFAAETALPVELLQGLPTGDKFDLIVQKNTELGVSAFQPLVTERSQFSVPANKLERRVARWQRIVAEAARQSERSWLPRLFEPSTFKDAVSQCRTQVKLMLWEEATQPLKQVLPSQCPQSVAVLVGPEGGLSCSEASLAQEHGFIPVTLGPRILRTETAGVAIAAILQFCYGDFNRVPQRYRGNISTKNR